MKKSYIIILIVSLILFIASLLVPAVYAGTKALYGSACFLFGGIETEGGGKARLANFLLFIAIGLTVCFLFITEVTANEAGYNYPAEPYGPADILWIVSCFSLFTGNVILLRSENVKKENYSH
ncbi:MAG: hypothetical protein MUW56_12390 [Chryseobacterium sp.]|uniref:hypothetical protein n=1 Tax=Chryseobacterium sp. TaxID=1871047 RepID=UPI0025BAB1D0|nr:hypothetical protein [Chryseobacterium sp.]MCJ7934402.1 hypothetical protein [Chryseobacterium sp.]